MKRSDPSKAVFYLGLLVLLVGAIGPGLLFPKENPILVGFIGAPFVLIGLIMMLAGSFPTQCLDPPDKKDGNDR